METTRLCLFVHLRNIFVVAVLVFILAKLKEKQKEGTVRKPICFHKI